MVKIDQITTGTGDLGMTSLADGSRVAKSDPRVGAYGTVDELNSLLGVVLVENLPPETAAELRRIQNDLFDLGSDIASPIGTERGPIPRIDAKQVRRLESAVKAAAAELAPAQSFVLPGGTRAAAHLHLARAVARRAEREVLALAGPAGGDEPPGEINPLTLTYLNRLSDLLFVYARLCNNRGRDDLLWKPGHSC